MYQFIYHIIFFLLNPQYFYNIDQKNDLKIEFNKAFSEKKYQKSIKIFEKINEISRIIDPELNFDAAHAYFYTGDTLNARIKYETAKNLPDALPSSQALNQLGIISLMAKDSTKALDYFKQSLKINPELNAARYNYELISKLFKPKTNNQNSPTQETQNQEVIASEEKEQEFSEYKSKNISKEKALQLLDDLKNSELKISTNTKNSKKNIEKDW
ncbi:MAG: tetratricopeptide repeat protein [Cytophagaceae bacterium]|nr:tetratricopeptide repeat protein [Cytophagaceae bacterium]MBK9934306.1 tetratricopeptide repeat protein [Cytophagaceae bacterium]MBL0300754.1 tetratricopeptide repeat protein [Cytophagaceae bacterium]